MKISFFAFFDFFTSIGLLLAVDEMVLVLLKKEKVFLGAGWLLLIYTGSFTIKGLINSVDVS
jgi:hypothetical protein